MFNGNWKHEEQIIGFIALAKPNLNYIPIVTDCAFVGENFVNFISEGLILECEKTESGEIVSFYATKKGEN